MMTNTLGGFCRDLLDEDLSGTHPNPEAMAARFVDYFRLPVRPTLDQLTGLMERAGFGRVKDGEMEGLKGAHIGEPRGEYEIYHRNDLWEGTKAHTVLHEAYEIIHETMCDLHSGGPPERTVCREADRFAVAVLMQPEIFSALAQASGLDVSVLQGEYRCSYASVTIRLAEVLRDLPLMAVLYEREERSDPDSWDDKPELRAKVVKRTRGFRLTRTRPLCGDRGGIPRWDRPLPPGSLAELAALTGMAEYDEKGGLATIARPVFWQGKLAKVIVVAVPIHHRKVLSPQVVTAPYYHPNSRAALAAP